MRKAILLLTALFSLLHTAPAQERTEGDTLASNRIAMRSTLYGVGYTNILDTYLSPVEYTGVEVRILHERMRMTRMMHGHVSTQSLLQAHLGYTENRAKTANELSGMAVWSYGLHYHFRLRRLKLLAGAMGEANLGFLYNTHNSNNPAQAKAYVNLSASGMAIYSFRVGKSLLRARYQLNIPLAGVMFSPDYQQSYYEIFTLGNHSGTVRATSLHNQPSCRQLLTLDIPAGQTTLRVGYVGDVQQSRVNHIKCHSYAHTFMVGFVRNFYLLRPKDRLQAHSPFD